MEVALLFWIICGLIAGYIYKNKGRSYGVGCIAGFLLGPIGIILALVSGKSDEGLQKQQRKNEEKLVASGEMKKCPHCAELIRADAKVCKHCGNSVIA
ncbi:MAG: zinc ribbon domain-containing protein [Anaerolineaceae bacterium]|nr:zinc ribbon domain-containing protein [Anaerolineaceae bacterium]